MAERKTVHLVPQGPAADLDAARAMLAALSCAQLVDAEEQARYVVVLAAALPTGMELERLLQGAAAGRFRLVGLLAAAGTTCPDALRVVARAVVPMTPEALEAVICADSVPDGGIGGFPPGPHFCGNKDRA